MRIGLILIFSFIGCIAFTQPRPDTDGDWNKQFLLLRNTPEASLMIRVGDIDNLGFGWEEGFTPFSGRSTPTHSYPWDIKGTDARGTDRIMVPSSYKYGSSKSADGYTNFTSRPSNMPQPVRMPIQELKNLKIDSAAFQIFMDDFQSPDFQSRFQFKVNGIRFTEAEKIINRVSQTGPIGKLVTIRFTREMLQQLTKDSLIISIDDPVTGAGDGFAIDFIKLLIHPKVLYKGIVRGKVLDAETEQPINGAQISAEEFQVVVTDSEGNFVLTDIPAGLTIVTAGAKGFASAQEQTDVIIDEESEIIFRLKKTGSVSFNNKTIIEGESLVLNNIQFDVNSAQLQATGKTELDKVADLMQQHPGMEILLSGHTSSEGDAAVNMELSLQRVRTCKDYLVSKGIDDSRITIRGYGPGRPVAPNDTEANRAINRRVELKFIKI